MLDKIKHFIVCTFVMTYLQCCGAGRFCAAPVPTPAHILEILRFSWLRKIVMLFTDMNNRQKVLLNKKLITCYF
jgi:hypothetical protein